MDPVKPIWIKQIRAMCVKYAADNSLKIEHLSDHTFIAGDAECIVSVPLRHLFDQFQQGHDIDITLDNEMNVRGIL